MLYCAAINFCEVGYQCESQNGREKEKYRRQDRSYH